jgi:hypothetical protein
MSEIVEGVVEDAGPAGVDRRTLIRAAAGGFALAASGLLLPERLVEETAAADHPVRRILERKDGHRARRRRRLERRDQNSRHDKGNKDAPVGDQIYKDIAFVFEVSGGRSVRVAAHNLFPSRGFLTDRWVQQGSDGPYAPGSSTRVDMKDRRAALVIDKNLWLKAENTLLPWENPVLWSGYGGSFEPDGEQPFDNGTFVAKSVLSVGSWSYKLERDGYSVQAQRLADDETGYRKVFNVKIVAPSA